MESGFVIGRADVGSFGIVSVRYLYTVEPHGTCPAEQLTGSWPTVDSPRVAYHGDKSIAAPRGVGSSEITVIERYRKLHGS